MSELPASGTATLGPGLPDLDWPPRGEQAVDTDYARYAAVYDLLFDSRADDGDFYLRFAADRVGERAKVLDVGCGTGRVTARLVAAGHRVVGLDASEAMLTRAHERLSRAGGTWRLALADMRALALPERFQLAVAPYGTVGHLLSDADRLAAFRAIHAHLEPGGWFVFDDKPSWLAGTADPAVLDAWCGGFDPAAGLPLRMLSNHIAVADQPLTVRYDFIDWLDGERVARRLVARIIFREIDLVDELRLLRAAGFERVEALGGFDGRPFDPATPAAADRLILCCRRGDE